MSIQSIEDDPLNPDIVRMVDPDDDDEAGNGEYADPRLLDAITHIPGQGANREWGPWLRNFMRTVEEVVEDSAGTDLDAVLSGVAANPIRDVESAALRTRPVSGTNFSANAFSILANQTMQVAYYRPERTKLHISNTGAGSVFLGSSAAACAYEIKAGSTQVFDFICDAWLRADNANETVSVLDVFATDIDSQ